MTVASLEQERRPGGPTSAASPGATDGAGQRGTPSQVEMLLQAFRSFSEVSDALQTAYGELQSRVDRLSRELEQSNYYLESTLQSLPCGVLVVNPLREVTLLNSAARVLFAVQDLEPPFPLARILRHAAFSDRAEWMARDGCRETEIVVGGPPPRTLHCLWSEMRDGERVLVVQDVTRLRELERRMVQTERVAAMGEMAMEVAHEIRNPLGALELFATLLAEDDLSSEDRRRYLGHMQLGIRSLNTVLTNMLCFRRSPVPQIQPVRLGQILSQVGALMGPLLEQRNSRLQEEYSPGDVVPADPEMVRQICTNLITNAMQALPEGGVITLRTVNRGSQVELEVEDNGPGIPEEYREAIFEAGFSRSHGGTGLGLSIVSRFMEALGGTIRVESKSGQGTKFILAFPRAVGGGLPESTGEAQVAASPAHQMELA
jgi:signal transduction histidine kinase